MLSYLANLILLFLLLATISESQSTTSTSTTTSSPVSSTTSTTSSTTSGTSTSSTASSTNSSSSTTKASNATNGTSVTHIKLIKSNATSNFYLFPYVDINGNFTIPFAINECSSINLNASNFIKPICVSNKLLNATFYNNSGCTSKAEYYELINDTSIFVCNSSNNYAELSMSANTSCPGNAKTYVGIGNCFPTSTGYASFLCSGKYLQYNSFNSSSCNNNGLLTINQVNSTLCGPLFNDSIYTSLKTCVDNATKSSTTSTSTPTNSTTSGSSTTSTTSTTSTASTTSTTQLSTSSSSTTSSSTTTTKSPRKSSASSVFILNNVVYILSIITIMNVILC